MRETNFKQTEIGLIPEDWEVRTLAECGTFTAGSGFPMKYQGGTKGKYPFYKVSDMNLEGNEIRMLASNNYLTQEVWNMFKPTIIPSNSIIFAKIGAAIFLERKRLTIVECCIDNNMQAFVCSEDLDEKYALYVLLLTHFSDISSATALPALKTSDLKKIAIRVPSNLEQKKISNVLSNIDNLIVDLRKLVDKKRAIKAAAMSNLLSGRVRLSGFTEPWEEKPLKDLCRINPPSDLPDEFYYVDLDSVVKGHITKNISLIDKCSAPSRAQRVAEYNDIFFQTVRPYQQNNYHFKRSSDYKYVFSTGYAQLRALGNASFLYYALHESKFVDEVILNCSGTSYPAINPSILGDICILIPSSHKEQEIIAKILTDMDAEIAALEAKLKKYEQLKQGMMQQLLTGKIRLVSPNESMS